MALDEDKIAQSVTILRVIADETRLRILGLLAEQDYTGKELAAKLELTPPTISHHMRKLVDAGIVTSTADAQRHIYALNSALLRNVRKDAGSAKQTGQQLDFHERTLRNFFDGARLKSIPAQRKQRVIVLQKLLERFEPRRHYPERDVNEILQTAHDDFATLRRELVDYGFMVRENGIYEVAETLPPRSPHVAQEITGDEHQWLNELIRTTISNVR